MSIDPRMKVTGRGVGPLVTALEVDLDTALMLLMEVEITDDDRGPDGECLAEDCKQGSCWWCRVERFRERLLVKKEEAQSG